MYDIVRLIKRIYKKYPPGFWYTVLFIILLIIFAKPLISSVAGILITPDPTATPRPTPDISQTGKTGKPLLVLDTYYTLLGYREFDSNCFLLEKSSADEPEKTVVLEFWARHYGSEPVEISNFYLRDGNGTNYSLTAANRVEDYRGVCAEPLSEGLSRPAAAVTLGRGYGAHFYLYSRKIPAAADGLEFTFQSGYSIPYPVTGTPQHGSSKVFIPLYETGSSEPSTELLGVPDPSRLVPERAAVIGNTAIAVNDAFRVEGDNDRSAFCLELLFRNISDQMMELNFTAAYDFAVVDDYGVAMNAGLSRNSGYNSAFAPGEIQQYRLTWNMEQPSARMRNLYLRVRMKEQDSRYTFIRIPFKESMLITPSPRPTEEFYLYRTPLPDSTAVPATPAPENKCRNALPPRMKSGDTAAVTYVPPVANRFRKQPGYGGIVIGMLEPGSVFRITDGPVCADGIYWYAVSYNGRTGWTAESDGGVYWLEKR